MSRGFSLYLDAVRFFAAVLVLFSHVAYARYSNGDLAWMRDLNLGSDAVILFFVLSGFVIAYTTGARNRTGLDYSKARMARLYSVIVPALIITLLCDLVGRTINPAAYDGWWYNGEALLHQIGRALTFTSHAGGDVMRIGTNGPFWSVAYEAWYYLAFGLAVFTRGWLRVALLLAVLTLAGLPILLLAPCWLAGVGLQRLVARANLGEVRPVSAWTFALAPWLIYALFLAVDLPRTLTLITYLMLGAGEVTPNQMFGFSDEFIWNYLLAALFSTHFFGVFCLAKNADWIGTGLERAVRWLAGATFSIYLFHYPLLTLLHAIPGYEAANPWHYLGAGLVTLCLCFVLAEVSERRLSAWKQLFDRVFALMRPPREAQPVA
ncbi:MAG: acyltransferase [Erythrobacter sp.]|jgi:peptidoglycan/LPS O-acetylase OafA/YrhL|nr:acyltransferase [Erythrobacter sp.]